MILSELTMELLEYTVYHWFRRIQRSLRINCPLKTGGLQVLENTILSVWGEWLKSSIVDRF